MFVVAKKVERGGCGWIQQYKEWADAAHWPGTWQRSMSNWAAMAGEWLEGGSVSSSLSETSAGINRSSEAHRNHLGSGHSTVSTPDPRTLWTLTAPFPHHASAQVLLCPSLPPSGKTLAPNPLGDTFSHVWDWTQTQLFPSPSNTTFAQFPVHNSLHRAFLILFKVSSGLTPARDGLKFLNFQKWGRPLTQALAQSIIALLA